MIWTLFLLLPQAGNSQPIKRCLNDLLELVSNPRHVGQYFDIYPEGRVVRYRSRSGNFRAQSDLKLMTFNILTLYGHKADEAAAYAAKKAKAIKEADPDILFLQEIEERQLLNRFAREELADSYVPLFIKNNEGKGQQYGVLVKRGLGANLEMHSFKNLKSGGQRSFTRDAQVTVVKDPSTDAPLLNIINVHLKSMRDKKGDPNSTKRRTQEVEALQIIFKKMRERQKSTNVPFLIVGDFNNDFLEPEFRSLRDNGFIDSFQLDHLPAIENPYTQYYFPINNPEDPTRIPNQIDYFILDPLLTVPGLVTERGVYRYTDENGVEIPIPRNFRERSQNPSDHYPVTLNISIPALLDLSN